MPLVVPQRVMEKMQYFLDHVTPEKMAEVEELPKLEIKLDLVPYDSDVLSVELGTSFRDLYLDQDRSELFYVAEAMMRLQEMYGAIPTIRTKGTCAQLVKDMMVRMRRERGLSSSDSPKLNRDRYGCWPCTSMLCG